MPADNPDKPRHNKSRGALFRNADTEAMIELPEGSLKPAAVMIPLIRENDNWSILYIRRAENKRDRHSGQVAFPGGRMDAGDESMLDTACREMHEEIGVGSEGIEVLGTLEEYRTISSYVITPVVAVIPWPARLILQKNEVARAFPIPLSFLKNTDNLQVKARELPINSTQTPSGVQSRDPVIYYDKFDGELLWGATARMTLNFTLALDDGSIVLPGL